MPSSVRSSTTSQACWFVRGVAGIRGLVGGWAKGSTLHGAALHRTTLCVAAATCRSNYVASSSMRLHRLAAQARHSPAGWWRG